MGVGQRSLRLWALLTTAAAVVLLGTSSASAVEAASVTLSSAQIASSAPQDPAHVIATATDTAGHPLLLQSHDSGATWTSSPSSVTSPALLGQGDTIIGVQAGQLVRSTDSGATWSNVGVQVPTDPDYLITVLPDPTNADRAWLCAYNGQAALGWQTADGGATWTKRPRYDACRPDAVQPGGSHVLMATDDISPTESYILRSTNGGTKWQRLRLPHAVPITGVAFDPTSPNVAVVAAENLRADGNLDPAGFWAIWRTTDGGLQWQKVWTIPAATCPGGHGRCASNDIVRFSLTASPVYADGRFVLGPLDSSKNPDTTRNARYAVSTSHGTRWQLFNAPYSTANKPDYMLPTTDWDWAATAAGLIDQGSAKAGPEFWRLAPGAKTWRLQKFNVTASVPGP